MTQNQFSRRWMRAIAAAALAFGFAAPAAAATGDSLRAALAYMPAVPVAPNQRTNVEFVDFARIAAVTGKRGGEMLRAMPWRNTSSAASLALGRTVDDPRPWRAATGFDIEHLDSLLAFGEPPRVVHLYGLAAAAPPLPELEKAWAGRGFRAMQLGGAKLWGRGEPLKVDFTKRDPADPFGGMLGRGSFLLAVPPRGGAPLGLLESAAPELVAGAARAHERGGAAARADIAAMLDALDRDFAGGHLLQAWIFPHMSTELAAPDGIAPYTVLVIADIEYGAAAETAIILVYADCAAARAAEREIADRWDRNEHQIPLLPRPRWRAGDGPGPCPLIGKDRSEGTAAQRDFANPPYRRVVQAFFGMHLPLLPRAAR